MINEILHQSEGGQSKKAEAVTTPVIIVVVSVASSVLLSGRPQIGEVCGALDVFRKTIF